MTATPDDPTTTPSAPDSGGSGEYRVLARKYRPATFDQLIGQQAMVRTLTNAIAAGRLAHAFILTGVRGIGKTTTARLIARALNCIGADGTGGPTIEPCGVCDHCTAIAEDRHVDVMELDAASRTGVDDVREIIEGVRYRPTSARFKVYIIDEVHMLTRNAFNALLKTLEEPPEHVKFIFATTEIRKIPVTVLSRCQRFDLRRVDQTVLADHFAAIAAKEGAGVGAGALALIARAADGSVRDGLSLLDQAIAHCGGTVNEDQVRDMLGLADRARTFDLYELVMQGDMPAALATFADQYGAGADPVVVLQDMLELTHWLTRLKVTPTAADGPEVSQTERERGLAMAAALAISTLTRNWQMLLKGLGETQLSSAPLQAAEMVLVRLAYAADLPSPAEAVKALKSGSPAPSVATNTPTAPPGVTPAAPPPRDAAPAVPTRTPPITTRSGAPVQTAPATLAAETLAEAVRPDPQTFEQIVELAAARREVRLRANLINNVHLVHFEPGRIEFQPSEHAETSLAGDLARFLNENTARQWLVTVSRAAGAATLHQQREETAARRKADAAGEPLVSAVIAAFPGAVVDAVRDLDRPPPADPADEGDDTP